MNKIYNIHPTITSYSSRFHDKLRFCKSFLTLEIETVRYLDQFSATRKTLKT